MAQKNSRADESVPQRRKKREGTVRSLFSTLAIFVGVFLLLRDRPQRLAQIVTHPTESPREVSFKPSAPPSGAEKVRWYESELVLKQVGAAGSLLSAAAIVTGVVVFLKDWWTDPILEIDTPFVMEFRCSSTSYNPEACLNSSDLSASAEASTVRTPVYHTTVSAAFRMTVKGPSSHSASIDRAWADVKVGSSTMRLYALWSANLVPGTKSERQQVVPVSLVGGQAVSQEIWFFPHTVTCDVPKAGCDERANFVEWPYFVQKVLQALAFPQGSRGTNAPPLSATTDFCVKWRKDGEPVPTPLCKPCTFHPGATFQKAVSVDQKPVYVTVVCKEADLDAAATREK